jgi:tetratricopeptide (TPR) repeat protein
MSGSIPAHWLDRVSESLREHEDRQSSLQGAPPRYEVLSEISRGGMGIVYRAWDPQLGRNVALKVLRSEEGKDAQVHERFQREAKLAAGLHHPHIVQIFDTGTWNGQDYIAMQLIEGTTLDQAKPDRRQALACIRDAARGLHYAHEQGIVHRDVKPGNLLIDGTGRVFVSDFGVARQAVVSATITSPGTVVGTPAYMSPEQAQGLPTDARSDVYSLGATLYELVTGRPPVAGRDPLEVVEAVRTRDPAPPRTVAPDLSKNVEAIILGAMERVREERYASAAELADDIDRYLRGERPLRRSRGMTYRVRREFVRHPWRSTAAIVLCALLLLAGVFLGYWIRGYLSLNRGLNATDREERKRNLTVAAFYFESARNELANIREEEQREAVATERRRHEEERRQREAQIRADNERKQRENQANIEQLNKNADQAQRQSWIAQVIADFLNALTERSLLIARASMEALKDKEPGKYQELLPKLRKLEFDTGLEELRALAATADRPAFEIQYAELQNPVFASQPDLHARLSDPVFRLAITLKGKKELREAVNLFDDAERLGVHDVQLYEQRGLALLELENWARAQHDFDDLLGHTPGRTDYPREFAVLSHRRGQQAAVERKWTEAIKEFTVALRIDSDRAAAYHDRGLARFRSNGQAREALEQELKVALSRDPKLVPDAQYGEVVLAFVRAQVERYWKAEEAREREAAWREALSWLTLIRKKGGDSRALALEQARMHRRLKEYDAALEELRGLPEEVDALRLRGQIRYAKAFNRGKDSRELSESLGSLDQAVRLNPKDPLSLYWRGTCRHVLRDLPGACEDLKAARDLGLDSADLHHQLSRAHLDLKEYSSTVEQASSALERAESFTEEEYVSNVCEDRGLSRSAGIKLLERDTLFWRAMARVYLGEFRNCYDDCTRVIGLDPQFGKAYILRGDAACRDKRHQEAQADYASALSTAVSKEDKDAASQRKDNCAKHQKE